MAAHNELGKEGELRAREFLQTKGYKIRHVNWKSSGKKNELDIVAEKDGVLVVVEVKSRSSITFEHPEDAITQAKIRRIVRATHAYILAFNYLGETRFDVISALSNHKGGFDIEHIEDAFLPPIN